MTNTTTVQGETPAKPVRLVHRLAGLMALLLVTLLAAGIWLYRAQGQSLHRKVENDLNAIARLKVDQLAAWRREQVADAASYQELRPLTDSVARYIGDPGDEAAQELRGHLRRLADLHRYDDILVTDPGGRTLLSLVGPVDRHQGYAAALAEALRVQRPVLTELHRYGPDTPPHMAVVAPLDRGAGTAREPFAALVLVINASEFLYPLVQLWPTPSRTAETLLVQRDGEDVLFLNDLRHRAGTALTLRIPLSQTDVPAVKAVQGMVGVFRGKDYRGVKVISVIRPVPDSPWVMVAKIDAAEAFAEWRFRSALMLALMVGIVAVTVTGGLVVWQRERKSHYQALYHAEAVLRLNVERHSITLKSIGDAVIATDAQGLVELLNPVAEELTGWKQDEARGRPLEEVFRIVSEVTRATVESPVVKVLREGIVVGLANHTLLIAKDGSERPIADSGAPIRGDSGAITGVVLVFRDQTAERAAEEALRQSEARYRHTLDGMLEGCQIIGPDWRYRYVNAAAAGHARQSREALIGRTMMEAFPGIETTPLFAQLRQSMRDRTACRLENEFIYPDGSRGYFELSIEPVSDGLFILSVNITERKRAEARLQHLTAVLRALRNINQLIVHEKNRDALLRRACEILTETRGYHSAWIGLGDRTTGLRAAAESAIGPEFDAVRAELDRGGWPACCRKALAGTVTVVLHDTLTNCVACPLAHTCRDTAALAGALSHAGRNYGVLVAALPVELADTADEQSLFKELCDDIGLALHSLEAERGRERAEADLRQAQKMESVGRLAGGVAHDFNNLLMGILNYAELCREGVEPEHPIRPWLNEITSDAQRSAGITRQLLAFARKQTIAPVTLDLNDHVSAMLKLLRRLIGEDIDLAWRPGAGAAIVKMDPSQIDQILANLAVNARDAIGGVGKVTVEVGDVTFDDAYCVAHAGYVPGDYVMLAVSDTGCGMDKATVDHLFEPFFTTKRDGLGTGLGLATVYGIVRQNNGFVNVYSEPAKGTTFRVYLPRQADAPVVPTAPAARLLPVGGTETILLVEDEKSVRVTTLAFLKSMGYNVLTADSPAQGLHVSAEYPGKLDLLVTDVVMPGMSGRDLANQLTRQRGALRCIFMSGYTANVIAHRGVLEEGMDFLSKPFGRDELARIVREVLDRPKPA